MQFRVLNDVGTYRLKKLFACSGYVEMRETCSLACTWKDQKIKSRGEMNSVSPIFGAISLLIVQRVTER